MSARETNSPTPAPPGNGMRAFLAPVGLGAVGATLADLASQDSATAGVGGLAGIALGFLVHLSQQVLRVVRDFEARQQLQHRALKDLARTLRRMEQHLGCSHSDGHDEREERERT